MNIHFFELDQIVATHDLQLRENGGGKEGIQNISMLISAIHQPQSGAFGVYFHQNLFEMAAAYLYHIAKNHGFYDGNKRTALAVAIDFLEFHDASIEATSDELVGLTLDAAKDKGNPLDAKQRIASFFRDHSVTGPSPQEIV